MKVQRFTRLLMCCVGVLLTAQAFAQVKITLPKQRFKQHEQIEVAITNMGRRSVSLCVEFGQWSRKSETEPLETTPTPVLVEKHTKNGWGVLLIGPDIGGSRNPVVLSAGESQRYPFRLSDTGKMRIMLNYWVGESDEVCRNAPRGKTVRSKVFFVE